jgi:SAM-dependent methyltransferase
MTPFEQANRRRWDELAPIHLRSRFYDVEGFKAGQECLRPLEVAEMGDVAGQRLLHLQCHIGLDTLSWARRGAVVTGADASEKSVEAARALAAELGLPATFVAARVQDLPGVPGLAAHGFDVVFTSYGVLCWLPDLRPWARTVAHFLAPGGTFYIAEVHPFVDALDDSGKGDGLRVAYPYFPTGEPISWEAQGSYADRSAAVENRTSYLWPHPLGDVLTVLADAGLVIEFVHEHAFHVYPQLPGMVQGADGWWRLPEGVPALPLLFSLKARRNDALTAARRAASGSARSAAPWPSDTCGSRRRCSCAAHAGRWSAPRPG